ncbi:MAG: hypothetical protein ACLQT6_04585 [Desulfomonilaceae bacterium]
MSSTKANGHADRKLFYIPIVHTEADMGALSEAIKMAYIKKMGLQAWKRKRDLIERFWKELETAVENLNLPYPETKIYQDGLPLSDRGNDLEIVNKLAYAGSRNHELLKKLVEKGATLIGTESPNLLLEEYNLATKTFNGSEPSDGDEAQKLKAEEILKRRDEFIAKRINETLKPGEIGILFIGSLHNVIPLLDPDIETLAPNNPLVKG